MLTAAFSNSASGMLTMNKVMDTVSNNMSNANTPFFSRSDQIMSDLQFGGVTSSEYFRFNASSLERIASLEGAQSFQESQSGYLENIQASLSATSTQIGNISYDYKTALGNLAIGTDSATVQSTLKAQGSAMASQLNAQWKDLQSAYSETQTSLTANKQSAEALAKQLAQLNNDISTMGPNSATTNKLAQLSQDYAGLTGATIKFEQNGMVSATVGTTQTVTANIVTALPTSGVGGTIGGIEAAANKISSYMTDLNNQVTNYGNSMNAANGATALFTGSLATGDLTYTGAPVAATSANALLKVTNLDTGIGTLAGTAAIDAQAAANQADYQSTLIQNQTEAWQAKYGVDVDTETLKMKEAQRVYEANAKLISVADSMLGTLLSIKS